MAQIRVLDQDTINQIAAGEVIERPSSIVKELVENAVDAKSTAVTVEIKGGGVDFIRITDNGCGIEKDQVRKAFVPHATSKITKAQDLETVSSLGFRGEALSSIAAIARVELITKTDEGISGVRYVIEGGEEKETEEIGCPEGTTFVIKDVFYNTPARKKFLKSNMTEAGYVETFMQRLALSHPEIAFKFICDNKNKISTSGNGDLKDVIYQIFGRDVAMNLLPVKGTENGVRVEGFIGKPVISRGNRNYENYYVNGRYLKNTMISRAIEEGYKGHSMVHKFPFTVLMITMDPHLFDVNVHPAKMEMRFKNGEELYSSVVSAVKSSFIKKELIPEMGLGETVRRKEIVRKMPEPFEKKRREIEKHFSGLSEEKIQEIKKRKEEEENQEKPQKNNTMLEKKIAEFNPVGRTELIHEIDDAIPEKGLDNIPEEISSKKTTEEKTKVVKEKDVYGEQMSFADIPLLSEQARPKHRLIGQVFKTYWLVEYEDKLFFVDQHAAHEKVMYEKFKKDLENNTILEQMLAPPVVLSFSIKEQQLYHLCEEAFQKMGFRIEPFGGNEYCIRAVPANLLGIDPKELFIELFDQIEENSGKLNLEILTDKLASLACKAAVKGNTAMSYQEMDALMDQLIKLENPYQCPHGRPTMISMTKYELEKKFKRIQ
ncbi:MAG: DNA mismatch repair endonuclease MutL [Lachnospiraceae bacterium]|nr:DNA mismatch repair endonuclease MutL [Lachnospiraceae bacterium]MDY5497353.1 DNA mismatch repair endonuclease MutL [Anaerobutyricum sp.]